MDKDTLIANIKDIENELHDISDDADIPSSIRIDIWDKLKDLRAVIAKAEEEDNKVAMGRFIKTADGWYIDQSKIDAFTVAKYFDTDGKGAGYAACAYSYGQRWRLKECETEAEAEAWLDKFVSKINGD